MATAALKLTAAHVTEPARRGSPRRVFTWDLAGVLTLLGSSAAYALFTLLHLA